mmetsp:Transcript_22566/g.67199  ORF Transcript_22566/g.67199 Transcript_22566/m.67199 type:complete len:248 (-) Transcript_22566:24-767(-)
MIRSAACGSHSGKAHAGYESSDASACGALLRKRPQCLCLPHTWCDTSARNPCCVLIACGAGVPCCPPAHKRILLFDCTALYCCALENDRVKAGHRPERPVDGVNSVWGVEGFYFDQQAERLRGRAEWVQCRACRRAHSNINATFFVSQTGRGSAGQHLLGKRRQGVASLWANSGQACVFCKYKSSTLGSGRVVRTEKRLPRTSGNSSIKQMRNAPVQRQWCGRIRDCAPQREHQTPSTDSTPGDGTV